MAGAQPMIPLLPYCDLLAESMDLISPQMLNHQRKTAYIAYQIAVEMNLAKATQENTLIAGLLHDIGAFSLRDKLNNLLFEIVQPHIHAEIGYKLLKEASPLASLARILRYHHTPWNNGHGAEGKNEAVPTESHLLHLADRIAVLLPDQCEVLNQSDAIVKDIRRFANSWFHPDMVDAFCTVAVREAFWLDVTATSPLDKLPAQPVLSYTEEHTPIVLPLAQVFSRIVDFRSQYTVTHSAQVAAAAAILAKSCGLPAADQAALRIAGHLHDLGKLSVPKELLEKTTPLSPAERNTVRTHAYHGFHGLRNIPGMERIQRWISQHHEKINGGGYPARTRGEALSLGSRIMAVADIFVALTEERAYRGARNAPDALAVMEVMTNNQELDNDVVMVLRENLLTVSNACLCTATAEIQKYRNVMQGNF